MLIPLVKAAHAGAILVQMATVCPAMPEPKVVVTPLELPMRKDFARNAQEIKQVAGNVYTPFPGAQGAVIGVMTGVVRANVEVEFGGGPIDVPPGEMPLACTWPTTVNIDITLEPTLYVNQQFPPGSCLHDSVVEHEMKHYAIDRATVMEFAPVIQSSILNVVRNIGVKGPLSYDETKRQGEPIGNQIRDLVKSMVDELDKTRHARNVEFDTPMEQAKVLQNCQKPTVSPMASPAVAPPVVEQGNP